MYLILLDERERRRMKRKSERTKSGQRETSVLFSFSEQVKGNKENKAKQQEE